MTAAREKLRAASAAFAVAELANNAAQSALAGAILALGTLPREIADWRSRMEGHHLAAALGEAAGSAPNAAELATLEAQLAIQPQVVAKLKPRAAATQLAYDAARKARNLAAQEFLQEASGEQARQRVAEALNQLRDALVEAMAVDHVCALDFRTTLSNPYDLGVENAYGPAARVAGVLLDINTWAKHPYSLQPTWSASNRITNPWDLEGLAAAEAAARTLVEEAAA